MLFRYNKCVSDSLAALICVFAVLALESEPVDPRL